VKNKESFYFPEVYSITGIKDNFFLKWQTERIFKKVFGTFSFFEKIIKRKHTKIIHAHFGPNGVYAIPYKRRLKLPLVVTFYGGDATYYPNDPYWYKAYQKLFDVADCFFTEGTRLKECLVKIGCPEKKIRILHLGADLEMFPFKERSLDKSGTVNILFCGRMVEKKGLKYLLEALNSVKKESNNFILNVIGDGPLKEELHKLAHTLNLSGNVKFLGYRDFEFFKKMLYDSHLMIQPSIVASNGDREGGAPTVLLDAQASGLPIVSTFHCDIPEVVRDTVSGFLVAEKDTEGLSEKILTLINQSELWAMMGRKGREWMDEQYNVKKQALKLEKFYMDLVSDYNS